MINGPIGLFYGSTTGNTEGVSELIAETFGFDNVQRFDVAVTGLDSVADFEYLIFGIPTWDYGELQEDWSDLWDAIAVHTFKGKQCAVFGLGDQIGYSEWFLDAMGLLHDHLKSLGATMVGQWPSEGYDFEASKALNDAGTHFVGLALDEDCQHGETLDRVTQWCQQLQHELFNRLSM